MVLTRNFHMSFVRLHFKQADGCPWWQYGSQHSFQHTGKDSTGGAFPGVLPGIGTQRCWGRTRRGNSSSDVLVSQLARDCLPQRPAARDDPALAFVFPGEVAYTYKTSQGKAIKTMCL